MYKNLFSPRDIRELNLYGKNCFQTLTLSICAFISCTILVNRRIVLWVYIISIKMSEKDPQYNWTPFLPSPAPLPSFAKSLISSYSLMASFITTLTKFNLQVTERFTSNWVKRLERKHISWVETFQFWVCYFTLYHKSHQMGLFGKKTKQIVRSSFK